MKILDTIADELGFARTISRLAHEILERNKTLENVVLIGIRTRGEYIARRLAAYLEEVESVTVPLGVLDVTMYRDDVRGHLKQPLPHKTEISFDINSKTVILVDDVLYTGRTARAALDALADLGRPACVQLAILVDRGHRQLPIRADFTGKNVTTLEREEIRVLVKEIDERDAILLVETPEHQQPGKD